MSDFTSCKTLFPAITLWKICFVLATSAAVKRAERSAALDEQHLQRLKTNVDMNAPRRKLEAPDERQACSVNNAARQPSLRLHEILFFNLAKPDKNIKNVTSSG